MKAFNQILVLDSRIITVRNLIDEFTHFRFGFDRMSQRHDALLFLFGKKLVLWLLRRCFAAWEGR